MHYFWLNDPMLSLRRRTDPVMETRHQQRPEQTSRPAPDVVGRAHGSEHVYPKHLIGDLEPPASRRPDTDPEIHSS